MRAKDVMSTKPEFLPPETTLQEAANLMKIHDYGFIPVGENDRLIGTVTDRDIAIRAVAQGKDPRTTTLRDIMSKDVLFSFEDDDLQTVADKMEEAQVRRMIVLNKDKRMVGIISLGDVATKCKDAKLCSELTEAVSQD